MGISRYFHPVFFIQRGPDIPLRYNLMIKTGMIYVKFPEELNILSEQGMPDRMIYNRTIHTLTMLFSLYSHKLQHL
jgi:hypothetical protein